MKPVATLTADERSRHVFAYLSEPDRIEVGAPAKEIRDHLVGELGDSVSIQAYYKLLDRMVAADRLESATGHDSIRRYRVAPYLHAGNAATLDDLYAMVETLRPTEAIARVVDARDYFDDHRRTTLRRAAEALTDENPIDLVTRFLTKKVTELQLDIDVWHSTQLTDRPLDHRISTEAKELDRFAFRYLGLSREAIRLTMPTTRGPGAVELDEAALHDELQMRVFGDRVLMASRTDDERDEDWNRSTVSGSDASTYANVMQMSPTAASNDDSGAQVVTFNNSVANVPRPPIWAGDYGSPFHAVPMTRAAIDDPGNRGMVLAPFMFRYLSGSEYEHMAKSATDVVQWRVDRDVFFGRARSLSDGHPLAQPIVHFRDGTVTPQEREWNHYQRPNEYGAMVREGLGLTREILTRILERGDRSPVFAGATKQTQSQFFSTLLNWYITSGSIDTLGEPIDPHWDITKAAYIADNEAMTNLLAALPPPEEGGWWTTFAVARPFHALTEFYNYAETSDPSAWSEFFERKRTEDVNQYERGEHIQPTYLAALADVTDDSFVWLCENADYVSFYVGHTAANPPPLTPRYEFIDSLRSRDPGIAAERVARSTRLIVTAVDKAGLSADVTTSFGSGAPRARIVPTVVYEAHETCKALCRKLEREVQSVIVANLVRLRRKRIGSEDVEFRPIPMRRFAEQFQRSIDDEPPDR